MPAEKPHVPVEVLRQAVRERVADTSIRYAADETGMSATGLWRFLGGTEPYLKTQRRLQNWYVLHHAQQQTQELPLDVARAAIALLTQHLSDSERATSVRRLLEAVSSASGDDPAWLETLKADREALER